MRPYLAVFQPYVGWLAKCGMIFLAIFAAIFPQLLLVDLSIKLQRRENNVPLFFYSGD